MNAVLKRPSAKRGCRSSADWKPMFDATPRITNAFSASCIRTMASARVGACVISLAIIES